jgi:hypothetical protein
MNQTYTRQRQGRDFSVLARLRGEPQAEANAAKEREKESALERMERFRKESDRLRTPADGFEPPEMEGMTR